MYTHTKKKVLGFFFALARQNVHCFLQFCTNFSFNHSATFFLLHIWYPQLNTYYYQQQEWCRKTWSIKWCFTDCWNSAYKCFFSVTPMDLDRLFLNRFCTRSTTIIVFDLWNQHRAQSLQPWINWKEKIEEI